MTFSDKEDAFTFEFGKDETVNFLLLVITGFGSCHIRLIITNLKSISVSAWHRLAVV